jgi:protein TonB
MGLDMNAVEAVRQYRFKPAMQNGKPVAVYLNVQVHFVTFDMNGQSPPINTIQP